MSKMLRMLVVWAALLVAASATGTLEAQFSRKEDVVTFKDGRVVRGTIVEFLPNSDTFLMRLPDGTFARFNKADISLMTRANPPVEGATQKNPTVSWLLSFAFPGGGQIYNGDVAKGIGIAVFGAAGAAVFFSAHNCSFDDECNQRRWAGGGLFLLAWLGSQVEAPIRASNINRDLRRVSLDVQPQIHPLGLSLARLRF
jgi:TM2 domain-containing membrane protein YozV